MHHHHPLMGNAKVWRGKKKSFFCVRAATRGGGGGGGRRRKNDSRVLGFIYLHAHVRSYQLELGDRFECRKGRSFKIA